MVWILAESQKNNYIFEFKNKNLCEKTNNVEEYYTNCVLKTSNPLFTYKDGYCTIHPDLNLPQEL